MKVGDLVTPSAPEESSTGVILNIRKDVEYPLLVEVLWDNGQVAKVHDSDLEIIGKNTRN